MTSHDRKRDLDKLTRLLGQCLGRIDEEANRLVDDGEDVDFDTADRLEDDTETLQRLVDELLVAEAEDDGADLNQIVAQAAESCLQELNVPVVLRKNLTVDAATIATPRPLAAVAVQRALALVMEHLEPGDELSLVTRVETDTAVVEIECSADHTDSHAQERSATLQEFVTDFGGRCLVRSENERGLFLVLELPRVMASERRE
ncbi:MAG TPA: hypothetical protein ENI87_02295 [bacterium]|nr:hypothetical protein [bacterium]